ncbi:MAG: DUF120 domain-containing protein, partial [Candidatus Caldarchaeum sp.]
LSKDSIENKMFLQRHADIEISGFKDEHRTYGNVKAIRVMLNETEPAVMVFPERTLYDNSVAELISQYNLREKLGLTDGTLVKVSAVLPPKIFYEGFKPKVSVPQTPT